MKLSKKVKIGYAFASLGDSSSYNFIGTFLLFFLTTVAGIPPALAGTITAIGAVCDTISSPIVGYVSDNAEDLGKGKLARRMGKRRPFILIASIPLGLMCCTMFTTIGAEGGVKTAYYIIMVMIFWVAFSAFFNPYLAMGAEITDDYNERTSLRTMAYIFNTLGMLVGMVLPNASIEVLMGFGCTDERAWQVTGIFVGALTTLSILVTVFTTKANQKNGKCKDENDKAKNGEKDERRESLAKEKPGLKNMLKDYKEIISLRPFWFLIATGAFFLIANSIGNSARMYLFSYNIGCSATEISLILTCAIFFGMAITPIINWLGRYLDKRKAYIIVMGLSAALVIAMKLVGMHTIGMGVIFSLAYTIGVTAYWQLMPAMIYDICELDALHSGKRREGGVAAVQCFAEAVSGAVGLQILGIILEISGFDGSAKVQSARALSAIETTLTVVVALLFVGSIITMILYPITKEKYNKIVQALAKQRAGKKLADDDYPL